MYDNHTPTTPQLVKFEEMAISAWFWHNLLGLQMFEKNGIYTLKDLKDGDMTQQKWWDVVEWGYYGLGIFSGYNK